MSAMNAFDVIVLLVFLGSVFRGGYVGFIKQTAFFMGIFLGVIIAAQSYELLAPKLSSVFDSYSAACIASYFIILFLIFIAVGFIGTYLKNMLTMKFVPWLDHSLGALFGALTALFLCSICLLIAQKYPSAYEYVQNSHLVPYIEKFAAFFVSFLPQS